MGTQALAKEIVTSYGQVLWKHPLLAKCMLDHFGDMCIIFSTSDVPLIAQELFPMQWLSHLPMP